VSGLASLGMLVALLVLTALFAVLELALDVALD